MRKIILFLNTTPDGFCDHTAVIADDDLHLFVNDVLKHADTVLFGRVTYQLFENYWPEVADSKTGSHAVVEFAELIHKFHKIFFSKTLGTSKWNNTTFFSDIDKDFILNLKKQEGKDILILGSPTVASEFIKLNLIDQYYFVVQPFIHAKGKHLFENKKLVSEQKLALTSTKTFKSGAIALGYTKEENIS